MRKYSGCWMHTDNNIPYVSVLLRSTMRRLRVYFDPKQTPESPDASLWVRVGENYQRLTGLWLRHTAKSNKPYYLLTLKEGNFRLFMNEFKRTLPGEGQGEGRQPDYVAYQLTNEFGEPVGAERSEPTLRAGRNPEPAF